MSNLPMSMPEQLKQSIAVSFQSKLREHCLFEHYMSCLGSFPLSYPFTRTYRCHLTRMDK